MALNNLGLALLDSGQIEAAITAYRDAVAIFRETGDHYNESRAQENLDRACSVQQAWSHCAGHNAREHAYN